MISRASPAIRELEARPQRSSSVSELQEKKSQESEGRWIEKDLIACSLSNPLAVCRACFEPIELAGYESTTCNTYI
jgi:hypothetical protein